jgi:poly(A) polymerase
VQIPGVPQVVLEAIAAAQQAVAPGAPVALVGGAVRDVLLHRVHNDPWRGLLDLDLVVEGSGAALVGQLAQELAQRGFGGAISSSQVHGAYGTVELELVVAGQSLLLDVATARQESYGVPAENPQVRFGALADDLARRDFTINAMALVLAGAASLSPALLDPHGGQADLERRQLRLLHPQSLRDDPTRLLRGARYGARLGFDLAPQSLADAARTLAAWPWPWRHGDAPDQAPAALGTRLRMELELLLEREPWPQALAALQRWGALVLLDPQLQADQIWPRRLPWAQRLGLPLMVALVAGASDPLALAERLQLPHAQHKLLASWLALRGRLAEEGAGGGAAGDGAAGDALSWCALLEAPGCSADAVALGLACSAGGVQPWRQWRRPLLRWWWRWRHIQAPLQASDLIAQGLKPGPALGARLRQLRAEVLAAERV